MSVPVHDQRNHGVCSTIVGGAIAYLKGDSFSSNRHRALAYWRMIFSDLASPAEAGFAKAGNRYPLFRIMR